MKRTVWTILILSLATTPLLAQKVYIDYDPDSDLVCETFAWKFTDETSIRETSALMHSRLKNAVEFQFTTAGSIEVQENPDCWVTYHGSAKTEYRVSTDNFGYGYPGGFRYDPYYHGRGWGGTSTSTVHSYEKGTLIIDVIDAEAGKLIWRGSATATIPSKPEKAAKLLVKAVANMVKQWEKMKKKM